MYTLISVQFSVKFLILRSIYVDFSIIVRNYSGRVPIILVRFYWNINFLIKF
jgi:hypothetical protein